MCPRKQHLAKALRYLEAQAQNEAKVLSEHRKWLNRAYYGLVIPSAMLAAAATTTALAEYTMIAGICAGVAAIQSSILVYLRNPYQNALGERVTEAKYIVLQTEAHTLRIGAGDISYESLQRQVVRLETELENLRLSRYFSSAPLRGEVNRVTGSELAHARSW
jgi:hypothetical protein